MQRDSADVDIRMRTPHRLLVRWRNVLVVYWRGLSSPESGTDNEILEKPPRGEEISVRNTLDQAVERIAVHTTIFSVSQRCNARPGMVGGGRPRSEVANGAPGRRFQADFPFLIRTLVGVAIHSERRVLRFPISRFCLTFVGNSHARSEPVNEHSTRCWRASNIRRT